MRNLPILCVQVALEGGLTKLLLCVVELM